MAPTIAPSSRTNRTLPLPARINESSHSGYSEPPGWTTCNPRTSSNGSKSRDYPQVATLARNTTHRLIVGAYLALGVVCALPLVSWLLEPANRERAVFAWCSLPLGLVCWSAAGLRVAMMIPCEPRGNWPFKLLEPVDRGRVLTTAAAVIQAGTTWPLAVAFAIPAFALGEWVLGLTVTALVCAAGAVVGELLIVGLDAIPCTCVYRPGQLRLRSRWPLYGALWVCVAYVTPAAAVWGLGHAGRTLAVVGSLALVALVLREARRRRGVRLGRLVFEEADPESVTTLSLRTAATGP